MRRTVYILLLIGSYILPHSITCQVIDSTYNIKSQFDNPNNILWTKHYKGRIDDLNDVAIELAYDGNDLKGTLLYLRSGSSFYLAGIKKENAAKLQEFDSQEQITGELELTFEDKRLKGTWYNFDKTIAGKIDLEEIDNVANYPTHCGNNKWIRSFSGKLKNESIKILLTKIDELNVSGSGYYKKKKKHFSIHGTFDESQLKVTLIDINKDTIGDVLGVFSKSNRLNVTHTDSKGKVTESTLKLDDYLTFDCIEYADYMTSYDFTFPISRSEMFNGWITKTTNKWISECEEQRKTAITNHTDLNPTVRAKYRAYGWASLCLYDHNVISGLYLFTNTWQSQPQDVAINYDLRNKRVITKEDVFTRNIKSNIKDATKSYLANHELADNKSFVEWIENQDFDLFTLSYRGVQLHSDFSSIYGRHSLEIPYGKIRTALNAEFPIIKTMLKKK